MRTSPNKKDRVKGAKKARCADCKRKVWISPASQQMHRRYPKTPIICLHCCVKRLEKEKKGQKEG